MAIPTSPPASNPTYDIELFWDPVCPFCWITSRWVVKVAEQTGMAIDWRLISLRLINKDKDYATEFPAEYEAGHTAGLRYLRIAAAARHRFGREVLGSFVTAYGESYFDREPGEVPRGYLSSSEHLIEVLAMVQIDGEPLTADVIESLTAEADNKGWDELIEAEGEMAFARTGRDVGTPIITHQPPDGLSFFGPVISRVPDDDRAVELWNAVTTLASFQGFAELKRSLREVPQLRSFDVSPSDRPAEEDWTGGHRAGHLPGDNQGQT